MLPKAMRYAGVIQRSAGSRLQFGFVEQLKSAFSLGRRTLRRSLWVILLGLHVIALGFAIRSRLSDFNVSGTTFRIVSLFLTSVFLALKVVDVRCLRFTPGWRSVAASIALVALLHVMVVERATNGAISAQTSQSVVLALVGSTAGVDLVRTIVRRLAVRVFADSQPEGDREFAILGRQRPRSSVLLWFNWVPAQFAARPPPLCS